jgi:hypothetical protein
MSQLAKLQFVGPAVLLVTLAGTEAADYGLACSPSSEILWYVNSVGFELFRRGEDAIGAHLGIPHVQLCIIGVPLFLLASCGLFFKRALLLAIASNLSFLYASFLVYAWYVHAPTQLASLASIDAVIQPDAFMRLALFACALPSFTVSHILYIRNIRHEYG